MALQLFKIQSIEVASPVTSVTFSSIPQGYTDLIVKISARAEIGSANELSIKINGTTGGYSKVDINGTGSAVDSTSVSGNSWLSIRRSIGGSSNTANTFSNIEIYMPNYTSSNYKSSSTDSVTENNATTSYATLTAGLSTVTSAITSLIFGLEASGGSFVANSTFTLYGVL